MRALLLSAYDAHSHRAWRNSLKTMFPDIEWVELILPARYFPWRVRGNSLSWAFKERATLTDGYDFLLCTSMTDLSALRGFVPQLAQLPSIVYCHENQFAYPKNPDPAAYDRNPVEPQILSLYTLLCADRVVFNSAYNRDSFRHGAQALLNKLPDHVPDGLLKCVDDSLIIPVPLSDEVFAPQRAQQGDSEVLEIVWNHRWEYDKNPALLLAIVQELINRKLRFRLHLLGQRFRAQPAQFGQIHALLGAYYEATRLTAGNTTFLDSRADYHHLLARADVALSTADHDFQGLSLLEAGALGCAPLAPHRLVYPEYLPGEHLFSTHGGLPTQASAAVNRLQGWADNKANNIPLPKVDLQQFRPSALHAPYAALFAALTSVR